MKRITFRLRTSEEVKDWMDLASEIKKWDSAPSIRINGKQKRSDGYYTSFRCNVDACHLVDVVTEILAYIEKKPINSFDVIVDDLPPANESQVSGKEESVQ